MVHVVVDDKTAPRGDREEGQHVTAREGRDVGFLRIDAILRTRKAGAAAAFRVWPLRGKVQVWVREYSL